MIQEAFDMPHSVETLKKQAFQLVSVCRRAIKRAKNKIEKQEVEHEEAKQFPRFSQLADSLIAHPELFHRGQSTITLDNIHTQMPETITLDPSLGVFENAQELYKKARKGKRGLETIEGNLQQSRNDVELYQSLMADLEKFIAAPSNTFSIEVAVPEFDRIVEKMQACGMIPRKDPQKKKEAEEKVPYRHITLDGYDIYIGRNDSQNDELSTRFCKPWDIWMHVAGHAGSHVVIKRDKNAQWPSKDVLLKVAAFAIWFSKAKHTSYAEVHVTEGRFVRKRRHAPAGEVIAERCKTLRTSPKNPQEFFGES